MTNHMPVTITYQAQGKRRIQRDLPPTQAKHLIAHLLGFKVAYQVHIPEPS